MRVVSSQWSAVSKRVIGFTFVALLFALCMSVQAQQPQKIAKIGYLSGSGDANNPGVNVEAFRRGLQDRGYTEGKNILVEYRYAEGKLERIPALVAELVQLKVDVLVIPVFDGIRAAKQATTTIPIVMVTVVDPVATGIVESLAHPAGNITGITTLSRDLSGKRLELLKEVIPRISRVGVLWAVDLPGSRIGFDEYETAAAALKIGLQSLEVRGANPAFEGVLQAAAKGRADALIAIRSSVLNRHTKKIAELALKSRLPLMTEGSDYVLAGSLVSYASDRVESYRRAAVLVDKILKGAKPADLPVEQPTKFELVINLRTAKQIGLTIPPNVLAQADRVIK
jgi:putative tryptophan/tyrosine transport system substrate-binding protein